MKKFLYFCIGIFLLITSSQKILTLLRDEFRKDRISFSESNSFLHSFSNDEEQKFIQTILQQEFCYLGKGRQTFAFESEDGQYVLKFIRADRVRNPTWTRFPQFLGKKIRKQKKEKFKSWMRSFKLAFNKLREETGLIYLHLHPSSDITQQVVLKDKMHRTIVLDPNETYFILQKKAEQLSHALIASDEKRAAKILVALLKNASLRCQKGISSQTRHCIRNTGIIDDKIIEFDIGDFTEKPTLIEKEVFHSEMNLFTRHLRKWLSQKRPDLLDQFNESLDQVCAVYPEKAI